MKLAGVGLAAIAAQLVVIGVAVAYGVDGVLSLAAAIVLAPALVLAVAGIGNRLDGRGFGLGAAVVYVLLPLAAIRFYVAPYHATYLHHVLPYLLGLRATPWFLLGAGVAVAARFAPRLVFAAAGALATIVAVGVWGLGSLGDVRVGLHESAWSIAFLEWLPIAGILGAARRSPSLAAGLAGWLAFFLLRAAHYPVQDGAFWRALAPALPAAAILLASVWLLVPSLSGLRRAR